MTRSWVYVSVTAAGIVLVSVLPLSRALAPADIRQARLIVIAMTLAVAAACAVSGGGRNILWATTAALSGCVAIGVLFVHLDAIAKCVATYNGRPMIVGREYTPVAADYVSKNPGLAASDLLLDAGGVPERVWTASSISSCRFWTGWGGLLAVPFLVASLCAILARRGFRVVTSTGAAEGHASTGQRQTPAYDAFISYRHAEPDRRHAVEVLEALESNQFRVAIDFRDFSPNAHFLTEMERCIRGSRFVLCVITSSYLASGNTSEEALISKTLDLADRRMRLVPLFFEAVEVPTWLYGLVGIDFTEAAAVDPLGRLLELVRSRDASSML